MCANALSSSTIPGASTTARRCAALVRLASPGEDEQAAADLTETAAAYGALAPLRPGPTLLSLGRAQRRLRKWAAARETLQEAAAAFHELGSPGWAEQASRGAGAPRWPAACSRRRADAGGSAWSVSPRRAVQQGDRGQLVVSVRTVEVHLKHAYASSAFAPARSSPDASAESRSRKTVGLRYFAEPVTALAWKRMKTTLFQASYPDTWRYVT